MRILFCFILMLFIDLSALPATAQEPQKQTPEVKTTPQDKSAYRSLVERAKSGDSTVDFVKLREAYLDWSAENSTDAPNRDQMVEAFKQKDYAKAVKLAEVVLDYEFINRGLHLATETGYRQLGDEAKANFHRDIAQELLQALLRTGDGKSPKTAYRVMSISEEYLIMRELGYEVHSQALLSSDEKMYDELMGTDKKTGKEVGIYFDISSFFGGRKKTHK